MSGQWNSVICKRNYEPSVFDLSKLYQTPQQNISIQGLVGYLLWPMYSNRKYDIYVNRMLKLRFLAFSFSYNIKDEFETQPIRQK